MHPKAILKTKFFRTKLTADFVGRTRLFDKLDYGAYCRLSLVSAPAGYGKSLLISSWLETCDRPASWVSLDREINDLSAFLHYFLFAVRKLFPSACQDTLAMLDQLEDHSPEDLCVQLINELADIDKPYILFFDDYG